MFDTWMFVFDTFLQIFYAKLLFHFTSYQITLQHWLPRYSFIQNYSILREENTVPSHSGLAWTGLLLWRTWLYSAWRDLLVTRLYTGWSVAADYQLESSLSFARCLLSTDLVFRYQKQAFTVYLCCHTVILNTCIYGETATV